MLPLREQPAAISDLGVPGDGADLRRRQRRDHAPQGVALEDRVRVDHHDHLARGGRDAAIKRRRLAGVGLADDPHPRQAKRLDEPAGAVRGAVVHDDHLELGVVARRERADGALDADSLVEGRHDY